jgi:hypothetical protein
MNVGHAPERRPAISTDEQVSNDLVKQIRKLRWIGMDREARLLENTLRRMQAVDVVLAFPPETD